MTQEERLLELEKSIQSQHKITLAEICDRYGISYDSARRDLVKLSQKPHVMRVRGGAIYNQLSTQSQGYAEKPVTALKQQLAQAAAKLVKEHEHILLDASTTLTAATPLFPKHLKIVTNSPDILQAALPSQEVFLLGGKFDSYHRAILGQQAEMQVQHYFVDKAFIGVCAINESGLTTTSEQEATLKRAMMAQAKQVILVCESSKFDTQNFFSIYPLSRVDIAITDHRISTVSRNYLQDNDIELITINI
ncbi:DeoR/GlpR family DNA-binding transcription regulator [Celerinatantimonas sp. YJH-8]|uniref:DeoR/GlpR family DNA-binding transcription regulator n=1 Tax=Celerinatantimonas sp. YJH-8 TaxID=3228714 RepID=UPI0038C99126